MKIEIIDGKMYPLTRETIERLLKENTQFKKGFNKLFKRRNIYKQRYYKQKNKTKEKEKILNDIKKWLEEAHDYLYYESSSKVLHNDDILEKYGFMFTLNDILNKVEIIEKILKLFPKQNETKEDTI